MYFSRWGTRGYIQFLVDRFKLKKKNAIPRTLQFYSLLPQPSVPNFVKILRQILPERERKVCYSESGECKLMHSTATRQYVADNAAAARRKANFSVFISAHARPQLHRFSLARFAPWTREISDNAGIPAYADLLSHLPPFDLRSVICSTAPRYASSVIPPRPLSSFLFLLPYPCLHTPGSGSLFCSSIHVYPREENVRRKKTCRRDAGEFCPARVVCFYGSPSTWLLRGGREAG